MGFFSTCNNLLLILLFALKFPVLQENLDVYLGLQQFIVTTGTSKYNLLMGKKNIALMSTL